ncbi:MAG: DUF6398 domain-containing protein [Chloroflexi bacterium]|nr:DUF6398 domain-containing protein [Chloroflexota bacterium]
MKKPYAVPKTMQEIYDAITPLTDGFCKEKLNEEYADMCRQMTAKLCRKRPSPLSNGRPKNWAAGIIHAIGTVNFVFDKSQTPHITSPDISHYFGVGKSSPASKSKRNPRPARYWLNGSRLDPPQPHGQQPHGLVHLGRWPHPRRPSSAASHPGSRLR